MAPYKEKKTLFGGKIFLFSFLSFNFFFDRFQKRKHIVKLLRPGILFFSFSLSLCIFDLFEFNVDICIRDISFSRIIESMRRTFNYSLIVIRSSINDLIFLKLARTRTSVSFLSEKNKELLILKKYEIPQELRISYV